MAVLNVAGVSDRLHFFLVEEAGLDSMYRKMSNDGAEVWRIEFSSINTVENPAQLSVTGIVRTRSILSMLAGDIEFPFSISSRTTRLD